MEIRSFDIHCHAHVQAAADLAGDAFRPETVPAIRFANPHARAVNEEMMARIGPQLTSVEARLVDMDRMGIDVQAISPSPFQYYYDVDAELARELSRTVNDSLAQIATDCPERFVALGTLPLQEPRLAVEELRRCVKELGLRGIEICSQINGVELSRARWMAFSMKRNRLARCSSCTPLGLRMGSASATTTSTT